MRRFVNILAWLVSAVVGSFYSCKSTTSADNCAADSGMDMQVWVMHSGDPDYKITIHDDTVYVCSVKTDSLSLKRVLSIDETDSLKIFANAIDYKQPALNYNGCTLCLGAAIIVNNKLAGFVVNRKPTDSSKEFDDLLLYLLKISDLSVIKCGGPGINEYAEFTGNFERWKQFDSADQSCSSYPKQEIEHSDRIAQIDSITINFEYQAYNGSSLYNPQLSIKITGDSITSVNHLVATRNDIYRVSKYSARLSSEEMCAIKALVNSANVSHPFYQLECDYLSKWAIEFYVNDEMKFYVQNANFEHMPKSMKQLYDYILSKIPNFPKIQQFNDKNEENNLDVPNMSYSVFF